MFPARYFPSRYFPDRYFPKVGSSVVITAGSLLYRFPQEQMTYKFLAESTVYPFPDDASSQTVPVED